MKKVHILRLSTDEYWFVVLVLERGQIPNKYSYLVIIANTSSFNICLHSVHQMQTSNNEGTTSSWSGLLFGLFETRNKMIWPYFYKTYNIINYLPTYLLFFKQIIIENSAYLLTPFDQFWPFYFWDLATM